MLNHCVIVHSTWHIPWGRWWVGFTFYSNNCYALALMCSQRSRVLCEVEHFPTFNSLSRNRWWSLMLRYLPVWQGFVSFSQRRNSSSYFLLLFPISKPTIKCVYFFLKQWQAMAWLIEIRFLRELGPNCGTIVQSKPSNVATRWGVEILKTNQPTNHIKANIFTLLIFKSL